MATDGRKRPRSVEDDEQDLPPTPTCVINTAQSGRARIVKRQRVSSYSELLKPGDVVFVWRPLGYKHYESKTMACIRQDPIEQFLGKEDSKLHVLDFSSRLVKLIYGSALDAEQVVRKAQRKLGKKGGKYHLFQNNCEHFAIKCKENLFAGRVLNTN